MADDKTRQLGDAESRILARLDMMERRFGDRLDQLGDRLGQVETRLSALEKTVEDRLRETRPIWERALAEIMATQADVRALHSKLDVLGEDVLEVRAKQRQADLRLKELEDFVRRA